MRLISCYHPTMVVNKYTGKLVVARCGHCPACLNARASSWVQRLDEECNQHPYVFFATFQYDEQSVNQFIRLRKEDNPNYPLPSYIDSETGHIISLKDIKDYTQADINYCYNTKVLIVHNPRDFQLFIKRLRKYVKSTFNTNFRYYAAFEYGPQTFRSHIHSLFFVDSSLLSEVFAGLLSFYWKHGFTFDPHLCTGSATQYVASYVNSFARLPKILLHKDIKQKALFSKCPPIGSFTWSKETFRQLFDSQASELTLYGKDIHKFRNVPLWRFVQSRIYPKFTAFNRLSHFDRVCLYRKGFKEIYIKRDYPSIIIDLKSPYWCPFFEVAFKTPNRRGIYQFNIDSLKRFVSVVLRVADNCRQFECDLETYVTKIEDFYDRKEKKELRDFYYLQDEYFKSHPISNFLLMNANFYISTKNKHFNDLQDWQKFYLNLYMPDMYHDDDIINFSYSDAFCYRELRKLHDKIFFDNHKRKDSNDWLLANKDKFNNIITYNQEIENYVESKII